MSKNKQKASKQKLWEDMTNEQLGALLGKPGRAKAIRAILRKRQQVILMLDPNCNIQLIK